MVKSGWKQVEQPLPSSVLDLVVSRRPYGSDEWQPFSWWVGPSFLSQESSVCQQDRAEFISPENIDGHNSMEAIGHWVSELPAHMRFCGAFDAAGT